jgi:HPt (histidine-containing phosphotransfer) domain-containing protein
MDSAAEQGELDIVHRGAHTIKGGALNIGASLVAETALQIEIKTKVGVKDGWQEGLTTLKHQLEDISHNLG